MELPKSIQSRLDRLPSSEEVLAQLENLKTPAMILAGLTSVVAVAGPPLVHSDHGFAKKYKQEVGNTEMHRKAMEIDKPLDLSDGDRDIVQYYMPNDPNQLAKHLMGCSNACNELLDLDEKESCWDECDEDTIDYNSGDSLLTVAPSSFSTWTKMYRREDFGIGNTLHGVLDLGSVDCEEWFSSGKSVPLPRVVTNGYIVLPKDMSREDFENGIQPWFSNAIVEIDGTLLQIKDGMRLPFMECDLLPEEKQDSCQDAFLDRNSITKL